MVILNCLCGNRIEQELVDSKIVCKKCYRIWTRKYVGKGLYDWYVNKTNIKKQKLI